MASTRWFPHTPAADDPGSELLIRLMDLLDRVEPMQLDGERSEATWTRRRKLSLVEVVLWHRTEPVMSISLGLSEGGGILYGHYGAGEFYGEQEGPEEMFADVESQLRQSYSIEESFWRNCLLRTVVRTHDSIGTTGLLSPVAAVVPNRYLRLERRSADYGCVP